MDIGSHLWVLPDPQAIGLILTGLLQKISHPFIVDLQEARDTEKKGRQLDYEGRKKNNGLRIKRFWIPVLALINLRPQSSQGLPYVSFYKCKARF